MAIPILGEIERLINEHGSAVILKEHLSLLKTKLKLLKEDIENLEKENSSLVKRNAEIELQLSGQKKEAEFVESRGAFFKPLISGGYSKTPYCPVCHRSMSCFRHMFPYECSNKQCGHIADFKGNQLDDVLSELP